MDLAPPPPVDDPGFEAWCRDSMVALAASFVGCEYAKEPARFAALVAPGETPSRQREMCAASTCGLFVRGLLGQLGCMDERLAAPYHDGRVIEDIVAMAHEARAVFPTIRDAQPGDIVLLGSPEHVFVIESIDEGHVASLQGGEVEDAAQAIERIVRPIVGLRVGGRPVGVCINIAALAARFLP